MIMNIGYKIKLKLPNSKQLSLSTETIWNHFSNPAFVIQDTSTKCTVVLPGCGGALYCTMRLSQKQN